MYRDIRNPQKPEYLIQVQIRFCLLETTSEQEDNFPPNVTVKVNGKLCQLPNPIATNKPGVEPRRPPRPVNVTMHVKISPTVANVIHVQWQWQNELTRCHVISCYLVRKLTSDCLLQRMKQKGAKPAEFTRGLSELNLHGKLIKHKMLTIKTFAVKEKLNEEDDSEIATTMLRVSLICPLGKMRMVTPWWVNWILHFNVQTLLIFWIPTAEHQLVCIFSVLTRVSMFRWTNVNQHGKLILFTWRILGYW